MKNIVLSIFLFSLVGALSGCGSDKSTEPEVALDPFPASSTAEGAVKRFVAVYNAMDSTEYSRLLTEDFTFEFSNATDPDLATQFQTGWFRDDEITAATNLFQGGTGFDGIFRSAADSITLVLQQITPADDTNDGRDPARYKVLLSPVTMTLDVPPVPGETEGTTFIVGAGANPTVHRLFLVRGDAAQLGAGQVADSRHWYIWRWLDESTEQLAPEFRQRSESELVPKQIENATWGEIKSSYR